MLLVKLLYITLIFTSIISCNEGLSPPILVPKSYISGKITYKDGLINWPPNDSVKAIRVVAFKNYPPKDIVNEIIQGNAFFTDTLPLYVDSSSYLIEIKTLPVELPYIVAVQNYGTIMEWRAIGVYTLTGDNTKPTKLSVAAGMIYNKIDITVDFKNLPPQPF